jgi:hypothetical protein
LTRKVGTKLTWGDRLGAWRVRWGIGRNRYRVEPGLYAVGKPTEQSPVFVSANFRMSFDRLRSSLAGRDGWIVVLDTKGINVWCAAGKGTFGTEELVRRLEQVNLKGVVNHRMLIVPQLGATGVCAHEVRRQSGFRVVFGPVRAADIPAFIDGGMKATPAMRRVEFPLKDRIVLIPVEIVSSLKYAVPAAIVLALVSGWGAEGFAWSRVTSLGIWNVALLAAAWLSGAALTPALLPWLPLRSFAAKGAVVGLAFYAAALIIGWNRPGMFANWAAGAGWLLLMPAIASYLALNFTGASTYTSLSGVEKEMRWAIPAQIAAAIAGVGLWVTGLLV